MRGPNVVYYDVFTGEWVLKKDPYAPPERYFVYIASDHDIFTEHLYKECGDKTLALDISYSPDEWNDDVQRIRKRNWYTRKNKFSEYRFAGITLPSKEFENILKHAGLEEEEHAAD